MVLHPSGNSGNGGNGMVDMPGVQALHPSGNSGNSGNRMADMPEVGDLHPSGNSGKGGNSIVDLPVALTTLKKSRNILYLCLEPLRLKGKVVWTSCFHPYTPFFPPLVIVVHDI